MQTLTSAEDLAQVALDVGVLTEAQLRSAWDEAGSSGAGLEEFKHALMRRGLLTNYQIERLEKGLQDGYFYGDYRVLYAVGSGTFARVFRAAHKQTGKIYAVKVLRNRHCSDPRKADLFRREGELGMTLKHMNIVPIHEVVSKQGLHFLVMDFIEGRNLREFYRIRKKFEPIETANTLCGVLAGLQYAFSKGISHRDLKMSNVLVSSSGQAKLVDFGLAALDGGTDDSEGVDRTVEYAALERATNVRKDDIRSDIYFAGCMMYQMLSGTAPLPEGRDRMQKFNRDTFNLIRPLLEVAPDTPMPIAMIVGKAMELDPDRRYQSPGDMLTELKLAIRRVEGATSQGEEKRELASQEGFGPDGLPRRLMIVESDTKRQDLLRDLFKRNGYRVLIASDTERGLQRFVSDPDAASTVLFCAATLGDKAVHAFNQFGEDPATRGKSAVLMLEESQGAWAKAANTADHRRVVVMPVKLRALREAVLTAILYVEAPETLTQQ